MDMIPALWKKVVGKEWVKDLLRHSYASYRFRLVRELTQLSEEMGNSPNVIEKSYLNRRVTDADAKQYWLLSPTSSLSTPLSKIVDGKRGPLLLNRAIKQYLELVEREGKALPERKDVELIMRERLANAPRPDFSALPKAPANADSDSVSAK